MGSTSAAGRIVARLLLETGRPTDAYDLLTLASSTQSTSSANPSSGTADEGESAWLLSRAALQLGRHEVADAMLAKARNSVRPAAAGVEPASFVGSKRCGECHGKIYREQQGESRHALTLRTRRELKDIPLPAGPVADPTLSGVTHSIHRISDERIEVESRTSTQAARAIVEYAVGSGRHGMTMVARDDHGNDRELRVSYFSANQSWGETKGINFAPREPGDYVGMPLSRMSLLKCLQCHATWASSIEQNGTRAARPEGQDRGIGCERCHGPGSNHVLAVKVGYADSSIALPAHAASSARLKSCAECHAADGSVQPSDPEFTRAQGTTFLFSRCYIARKDQMSCTTCHDPHRDVDTMPAHYEAVCKGCHAAASKPAIDPAGSFKKSAPGMKETSGARACPINPNDGCISCHMPKVEDPSRRARFTDHHIRIHRSAVSGGGVSQHRGLSQALMSSDHRTVSFSSEDEARAVP